MIYQIKKIFLPNEITCLSCNLRMVDCNNFLLCDKCFDELYSQLDPRYYSINNSKELASMILSDPDEKFDLIALFKYEGVVKTLIEELKFKGNIEVSHLFAHQAALFVKQINPDVLIPMPITKSSYLKRSYNQLDLVCKLISKMTNIPVNKNVLQRIDNKRHQLGLNKEQRLINLKNNFYLSEDISNKKILIIDDVTTTGSTLFWAKQAFNNLNEIKLMALTYA